MPHPTFSRRQSGFTLIEIAIVLVIIGLLLGGILKGQELINSARVKNLATDFRNIPLFIYGYQDKFRALPGDDSAAVAHVGGHASLPPAAHWRWRHRWRTGTARPLPMNPTCSGNTSDWRAWHPGHHRYRRSDYPTRSMP